LELKITITWPTTTHTGTWVTLGVTWVVTGA
jgi:hypothetical protein